MDAQVQLLAGALREAMSLQAQAMVKFPAFKGEEGMVGVWMAECRAIAEAQRMAPDVYFRGLRAALLSVHGAPAAPVLSQLRL
jgi:hypothetical protein